MAVRRLAAENPFGTRSEQPPDLTADDNAPDESRARPNHAGRATATPNNHANPELTLWR